MIFNGIGKILGAGALTLAALSFPVNAQQLRSVSAHNDMHEMLIASQRDIQEQIKIDETKKFMDIILQEEEEPEIDIYTESWNSQLVNPYGGMEVPDNVRIDVSEYAMPVPGYITSPYGYRPRFRRSHKGVDLKLQTGDTVRAAFSGKVRLTKYERRGYGYYVIIRHANGLETVYGHLSKFLVKPNQDVKVGEPIALGGSTGRSTGPHLHFETRFMGYAINPMGIFDFANQTTHTDYYTFNKKTYTKARDYSPEANAKYAAKVSKKNNSYSASGSKKTYKVRKGDTLGKIARRYGTTVSTLCRLNGISSNTTLSLGKVLRVK